ncbi:MAG: hypothetical protein KKG99_17445 [Bacteroidetes bacterium]|nr:hypothetical protein [Bacteroidota bacterium]
MIDDYQERIGQFSVALDSEKELKRMAIKNNNPDSEIALHQSEIKRLNDLRQLCIQVLQDLDSLD